MQPGSGVHHYASMIAGKMLLGSVMKNFVSGAKLSRADPRVLMYRCYTIEVTYVQGVGSY